MTYQNLAEMYFSRRQEFASHTGYKYKEEGKWISVSFKEALDKVERIAAGLASLGVSKGDKVAIISTNCLEWAFSDYAVLSLGAALVPIYPTLTHEQSRYIINDSQAKVLIVEDKTQIEKINKVSDQLPTVEQYFVIENIELVPPWQSFNSLPELGDEFLKKNQNYISDSIQKIKSEDIATIIYTSGTTGEPKGAILTHKNFLSNIDSISQIIDCSSEDILLSFLPLSHIFERAAGQFFASYHAATVAYAESIDTVAANMLEIKPTLMVSVPRLYEKMYSRILETVELGSSLKRKIFYWSVNIGREYMPKVIKKEKISVLLKIKRLIAFKLVFSKLKKRVGGRLRFFVSGGAPLSAEIGEFFNAAGLLILEGYGLTETSPGITFNRIDWYKFGTVGQPLPGIEVKIADDGEILTRGDHVMLGYFNKEAETKEAIDNDGWFYTGDIGFIDDDGFLTITDRKKNIIVTSGGKNIAPQPIENNLITSKYIEQVVVIGDNRKFCSAVIVASESAAENWARKINLEYENFTDLVKDSQFVDLLQSEIDRLTENFSSFERIQKFIIIPEPFTQESGELTPTLKVKRKVIEEKYLTEINQLYEIE
jgi:long-chain acyl-CoA synthetase